MIPRLLRRVPVLGLLPLLLAGCVSRPPVVDFSPNGSRVVFPAGEKNALHVGRPGTDQVEPLKGTEGANAPRWSPDGGSIAFVSDGELFAYRLTNGAVDRIAQNVRAPYVWSLDSRQLAALHVVEEGGLEFCWYDRPDAGPWRRVELPLDAVADDSPIVWLPESEGLAFIGQDQDGTNVFAIENGILRRVSTTGDVVSLGASPDGRTLVWARSAPHLKTLGFSLFAYDRRARGVTRLPFTGQLATPEAARKDAPLVYRIYFAPGASRLAMDVTHAGEQRIYTSRLDGAELRIVDRLRIPERKEGEEEPEPQSLLPSWSRDGRRLAIYHSGPQPAVRIHDASGVTELALPDREDRD